MQTLEQLKRHVLAPQPGFLYEPRAFWDVGMATLVFDPGLGRIDFDSDHFYNGSKYPIVLTQLTFDPAISAILERVAFAGFTDGRIRIASSGNQSLTRDAVPLRVLLGQQSYEPPSPYAATPLLATGVVPQTGVWGDALGPLWGLTQWNFHYPLLLPKDGAITFSLGSRIEEDLPIEPDDTAIDAHLQFFETGDAGGFYSGNARAFQTTQQRTIRRGSWGSGYAVFEGGSGTDQPFPPTSVMSGTAYRRQNVARAGSTQLRGFSVMLDQRRYDTSWNIFPGPASSAVQSRASATPVKARTSGCGTEEAWWRDGAPLSLVTPSRTNALTAKLPVPITLQPGDGLDVSLEFNVGATQIQGSASSIGVAVGVSFTGFAAIEN